jgi:hypothetical protein
MTLVKEVGQDLDQSLVIHATVHILIVQGDELLRLLG